MSQINDHSSNQNNEFVFKYVSCNDVLDFDQSSAIDICSKCVNWRNDKLSPLYIKRKKS